MKVEIPLNNEPELFVPQGPITLFLLGEINLASAGELARTLIDIENDNQENESFEPIQLIINSPGGDLYSSWMVCDIMATMQTPIHTYGLGQVASGGFMIFMNGTQGERKATTNTQFMSHRYSMAWEGTHANIKSQQPELDRLHQRIINHYRKNTGLSEKDIVKHLLTEHDVWLTADECKKFNVCDQVLDMNIFPKITKKVKKNA